MQDDDYSATPFQEPDTTIRLGTLVGRRSLSPSEIAGVRVQFPAGLVHIAEAERLFAIAREIDDSERAWSALFVELLTDFVVWGQRPSGVIRDEDARWVIGQCDGHLSATELALLINLLDEAHVVPGWFKAAVRQRAARLAPASVRLAA